MAPLMLAAPANDETFLQPAETGGATRSTYAFYEWWKSGKSWRVLLDDRVGLAEPSSEEKVIPGLKARCTHDVGLWVWLARDALDGTERIVALVSLSLFTLVTALLQVDARQLSLRFSDKTPVKTVRVYLLAVAFLVFLGWMKQILPTLVTGQLPESIALDGTPSNPVFVLDLGLLLPAFCLAAIWLWRRHPWGYVLCGMFLVKGVTLTLAILSMSWFMVRTNQQGLDAVSVTMWGVIAVTSLVLTVISLTNLHEKAQKVAGVMTS